MTKDHLSNAKNSLARFVADSVRIDKLVGAQKRDAEFIKFGGEIVYTPDHSLWSSFFYPVRQGGRHKDARGELVPGFTEVFREVDTSETDFLDGTGLSEIEVGGMLGKILMDHIFDPAGEDTHVPDFYVTPASKMGLESAIEFVLSDLSYLRETHKTASTANNMIGLKDALDGMVPEGGSLTELEAVAKDFYRKYPQHSKVINSDKRIINLSERLEIYNGIGLFDWGYLEDSVKQGENEHDTFGLTVADLSQFEKYRTVFSETFRQHFTDAAQQENRRNKFEAMAEVLAMNAVIDKSSDTRFVYLTASYWSIYDFDDFYWDPTKDNPLVLRKDSDKSRETVSTLFVRHPACFLSEVDYDPQKNTSYTELGKLVETVVPKAYTRKQKLGVDVKKLERKARKNLESLTEVEIDTSFKQLQSFYFAWAEKKMPWVVKFWVQRAETWGAILEKLDATGKNYGAFLREMDQKLAEATWPLGVYLSMATETHAGRAAPLVYIDCEPKTNNLLGQLQEGINNRSFPHIQAAVEEFNSEQRNRNKYFTYLVNSVVFMSANQFKTAQIFASLATDVAYELDGERQEDQHITGREAYYLRSLLTRVCAQNPQQLETARKLMLIAKAMLAEDNSLLVKESQISSIRFDLESWSREIVQGLFDCLSNRNVKHLKGDLLERYLAYTANIVRDEFTNMSEEEKGAAQGDLFARICDKVKFNFMVLCVMVDRLPGMDKPFGGDGRRALIEEWNSQFGGAFTELKIIISDQAFDEASTIERAYFLTVASLCGPSEFVQLSGGISQRVTDFFGPVGIELFSAENKPSKREDLRSACTSRIDRRRYEHMKMLCHEALQQKTGGSGKK